jgi:hypothetical protein
MSDHIYPRVWVNRKIPSIIREQASAGAVLLCRFCGQRHNANFLIEDLRTQLAAAKVEGEALKLAGNDWRYDDNAATDVATKSSCTKP